MGLAAADLSMAVALTEAFESSVLGEAAVVGAGMVRQDEGVEAAVVGAGTARTNEDLEAAVVGAGMARQDEGVEAAGGGGAVGVGGSGTRLGSGWLLVVAGLSQWCRSWW